MSVNLSENIRTITETVTYKSSMYLLGMLHHMENFAIPMNESPDYKLMKDFLSNELICFSSKNKVFPLKKLKKWGQNRHF